MNARERRLCPPAVRDTCQLITLQSQNMPCTQRVLLLKRAQSQFVQNYYNSLFTPVPHEVLRVKWVALKHDLSCWFMSRVKVGALVCGISKETLISHKSLCV